MDCQPTDGWNNASFVAAAFAFHWVAIAAFITTFLVTFNMYPDQSDPTSWRRQCTCYGRLCCLGDSATSWVKQSTSLISRALNRSFRPTRPAAKMPPRQQDMSPNKVAAAAAHSSPRHSYEPLPDRSPNTLGGSDDTKRKAPADASRAEAVGHGPLTTSGRSRSGVMRLEQMADMFFSVMSHVVSCAKALRCFLPALARAKNFACSMGQQRTSSLLCISPPPCPFCGTCRTLRQVIMPRGSCC